MPVVNSLHLFEQVERLIQVPVAGPPRQADLRRAISSAYYGVFHHVLAAAADEFVGITQRSTKRYALVYRSIDHRRLRDVCSEIRKTTLVPKFLEYAPDNGFGSNLPLFADALIDLQEKRHFADYDPLMRVKTADARLALITARRAIRRFDRTNNTRRKTFLTLLLFQPR